MVSKLAQGFRKASSEEELGYYRAVYTKDGKLWLFHKKGVKLPKYSWFHWTCLHGGAVHCLDTKTGQWAVPGEYPALDLDENREEIIFAVNNDVYALLLSLYETFEYRKLLCWDNNGKKWAEVKLDSTNGTKALVGSSRGHVSYAQDPSSGAVYLGITAGSIYVDKLEVTPNGGTVEKVIGGVPDDCTNIRQEMGWMTAMGIVGGKVALIGGMHGCGFRWEPEGVTMVDPGTKELKLIKPKHEKPPYSFSGPKASVNLGYGNRWVMVGGSEQIGMCDTKFIPKIWQLQLDGRQDWVYGDTGVGVPTEITDEYMFTASDGDRKVFVGDEKSGVFQLNFD